MNAHEAISYLLKIQSQAHGKVYDGMLLLSHQLSQELLYIEPFQFFFGKIHQRFFISSICVIKIKLYEGFGASFFDMVNESLFIIPIFCCFCLFCCMFIEVGLSPPKKIYFYLLQWRLFRNDEKCFLFHL